LQLLKIFEIGHIGRHQIWKGIPFLPQKFKAGKLLIISIFDIFSFVAESRHSGIGVDTFLPQKLRRFLNIFHQSKFCGKIVANGYIEKRTSSKNKVCRI
jgi:hypothetical protein